MTISSIRNVYVRRAVLVVAMPVIWAIYTSCAAFAAMKLAFEDVRDAW